MVVQEEEAGSERQPETVAREEVAVARLEGREELEL